METIMICSNGETVGSEVPSEWDDEATAEYVGAAWAVLEAAGLDWESDSLFANWHGGEYSGYGSRYGGDGIGWLVHPYSKPIPCVLSVMEAADRAGAAALEAWLADHHARESDALYDDARDDLDDDRYLNVLRHYAELMKGEVKAAQVTADSIMREAKAVAEKKEKEITNRKRLAELESTLQDERDACYTPKESEDTVAAIEQCKLKKEKEHAKA